MTAFWGELIGTAILVTLGVCVNAGVSLKKTLSHDSGWIVITFGWGFAVAVAIYAVRRFSGAHLNPAVTLALAFDGNFPWSKVPMYISGQVLGAIIGASIAYVQYLPHWKVTEDPEVKLGVFATIPAIPHKLANFLSEFIGTFILILCILAIGANKFTDGLNPLIIGFLIVSIGLGIGGTTGYATNPARDFGPRLAHNLLPIHGKGSSNWGYAWIPVVGPTLGGSLGGLFYKAVFLGKPTISLWVIITISFIVMLIAYIASKKEQSNLTAIELPSLHDV